MHGRRSGGSASESRAYRRVSARLSESSSRRWQDDDPGYGPSDSRPENKERSDVRHYKSISYKFNDTGWYDDKRTHLWVVDVKSGASKQIT